MKRIIGTRGCGDPLAALVTRFRPPSLRVSPRPLRRREQQPSMTSRTITNFPRALDPASARRRIWARAGGVATLTPSASSATSSKTTCCRSSCSSWARLPPPFALTSGSCRTQLVCRRCATSWLREAGVQPGPVEQLVQAIYGRGPGGGAHDAAEATVVPSSRPQWCVAADAATIWLADLTSLSLSSIRLLLSLAAACRVAL